MFVISLRLPKVAILAAVCSAAAACDNSSQALFGTAGTTSRAGASSTDMQTAGAAGRSDANGRGGNRFDTVTNVETAVDAEAAPKYRACISYTRAQCQRRFVDCGERASVEEPCSSSLDRCPDLLFSPGSSWTVESLNACAAEWKGFSCDEIRQNRRPSCAQMRGTRPLDAPCLFPSQCASGACTKLKKDGTGIDGYANCGVCGVQSDLGGTCDKPGYECAPELACIAAGTCVSKSLRGVVGATCSDNSTCGGYGIGCRVDAADGVKRCLVWPGVGQNCSEDFSCADGSLCQSNLCVSAPKLGESCGTKGPAQCAAGLVCSGRFDVESYVCIVPRKLGEVCVGEIRRAPRGNCEVGLRCDCGDLDCDLKSGVCRTARSEGESCVERDTVCVPGTSCIDGTCVATLSQPALGKLCPSAD